MKKHVLRLLLPAAALLALSSCTDNPATRGPGPGVNTVYSSYGTGFVTYSTLPDRYVGSTYNVQGRHYAGGRYESGRFTHQGRVYPGRYYHNGRYYYGGTHQYHSGAGVSQRSTTYRRGPRVGTIVNNTPVADSVSARNADIYTTSSNRGPSVSWRFR